VLPYTKFNGKINGKRIEDYYSQLDYSIEGVENRLKRIKEILQDDEFFVEYFDKWFKCNINSNDGTSENDSVCRLLEKMADYILYADRNSYERKKYKKKKIKEKEILVDNIENYLQQKDKIEKKKKSNQWLKPKVKITNEDIVLNPYIKQIQESIDKLKEKINKCSPDKYYKLSNLLKTLTTEQKIIKEIMRQPIGLQPNTHNFPHYNFDWFDFGNINHVSALLNLYGALKEQFYDNEDSDVHWLLDYLEYLIDKSNLKDYEKDILIWKIDGLTGQQISDNIKEKYGLDFSVNYISNEIRKRIPMSIVKAYEDDYEEWFYTFKAKGKYKKCSKCGKIYLAKEKYFGKHPNTKDGLQSICKNCDNLRKKG
jgi:hypothetical protein